MSFNSDFNPMKFDKRVQEEAKQGGSRRNEKVKKTVGAFRVGVQCTFWMLSALLSFAFGAQWFGDVFPLFGPIMGSIAGGLFVAFTFDVGAIVSLYVQDYVAETQDQQEIARRVKWIDFAGSAVASIAQIVFFIPTEFLNIAEGVKVFTAYAILFTTVIVFIYNLIESIRYHEASPTQINARHEAEQMAQARKRKHEHDKKEALLAKMIADDNVNAEIDTLTDAHNRYKEQRQQVAGEIARRKANKLQSALLLREGLIEEGTPIDSVTPPPADVMAMTSPSTERISIHPVAMTEQEQDQIVAAQQWLGNVANGRLTPDLLTEDELISPLEDDPIENERSLSLDEILSKKGYTRKQAYTAIRRYNLDTATKAYSKLSGYGLIDPDNVPFSDFNEYYNHLIDEFNQKSGGENFTQAI